MFVFHFMLVVGLLLIIVVAYPSPMTSFSDELSIEVPSSFEDSVATNFVLSRADILQSSKQNLITSRKIHERSPIDADQITTEAALHSEASKNILVEDEQISVKRGALIKANDAENYDTFTEQDAAHLPWENEKLVVQVADKQFPIPNIEISFTVAMQLCRTMKTNDQTAANADKKLYYLWVPIQASDTPANISPPPLAPKCLKWVLRQCRGNVVLPLLRPCTFWAPMPTHECGFRSETQLDHMHNPDFRSEKEIQVQDHLAAQLCQALKSIMNSENVTGPVTWIPFRTDKISGKITQGTNGREKRFENDFHLESESETAGNHDFDEAAGIPDSTMMLVNNHSIPGSSAIKNIFKEDGKHFEVLPTYNSTSPGESKQTSCVVWKFKACPGSELTSSENVLRTKGTDFANDSSVSMIDDMISSQANMNGEAEEYDSQRRWPRNKRSVMGHMIDPVGAAEVDFDTAGTVRIKRQRETEDEILSLLQGNHEEGDGDNDSGEDSTGAMIVCDRWISAQTYRCIPELSAVIQKEFGQEDSDESDEVAGRGSNKELIDEELDTNLCPGSMDQFSCLRSRRKRSTKHADETNFAQAESSDRQQPFLGGSSGNEDKNKTNLVSENVQPNSTDKLLMKSDISCQCDWPCMPVFDRINRCYDATGNMRDNEMSASARYMNKSQLSQSGLVVCIQFQETYEISCKINSALG